MSQSRRTAAKRTAGASAIGPVATQIDQLNSLIRAESSWFDAAAVIRNLEALFERLYRRYRAGLSPDHLMVEHRAHGLQMTSSAE